MKRLVLVAALAAAGFAGTAAAETYAIDPAHSQVLFTYSHLGFSNITGRFDKVEGQITYDPTEPAQAKVNVTIPIDSVSTGVADLDAHLKNADFFDAPKHPAATFTSTKVEPSGQGRLRVTGDLTVHGVTKPTTFDVTVNKIGEHPMAKTPSAGFDATATVKRSDFGVDKGVPHVSDEVRIRITVEAHKADQAES